MIRVLTVIKCSECPFKSRHLFSSDDYCHGECRCCGKAMNRKIVLNNGDDISKWCPLENKDN